MFLLSQNQITTPAKVSDDEASRNSGGKSESANPADLAQVMIFKKLPNVLTDIEI